MAGAHHFAHPPPHRKGILPNSRRHKYLVCSGISGVSLPPSFCPSRLGGVSTATPRAYGEELISLESSVSGNRQAGAPRTPATDGK